MKIAADWLTLRAKALSAWRGLASYWFSALVLAPMIVAGFYYILEPNVAQTAGWLRRASPDWSGADLLAAGLVLSAALTGAGLPSALRHAYSIGLPEAYLEALPISPGARFRGLLAGQALRNVPAWIALAAVFHLAAPDVAFETLLPPVSTVLVLLEIATLQVLTALLLVHLRWLRPLRLLIIGAAVLAVSLLARFEPLYGMLLTPLLAPASFFQAAFAAALRMDLGGRGWLSEWAAQAGGAAVLLLVAWSAYRAWRDDEVERAQAAMSRSVASFSTLDRVLKRRFGNEIGAQVARDLRLTFRGSTPAVWTCAAAAALFVAAMPTAILNHWVPEQWLTLLLMVLTGLAALCLSTLAPVLLQRHGAALWMEQSSGAAPEGMLKARKYFALIVAFPAAVGALLATALLPLPWTGAAYFAARAVLAWISVSTMIGAVAFDIAAAPGIGLMLAGLISLGVCGMYGFDQFWPIGLFLYAYLMHMLNERAENAAAHPGGAA